MKFQRSGRPEETQVVRLSQNLLYDGMVPKGQHSVLCLILPAEACPRIPESAGSKVYISTLPGEFLPMNIAPGNQVHAFNSAGFSWQLLQALSTFVYVASATRILHLRILFCRGGHGFLYGLPDLCRESSAAVRMHSDPESCLPMETEVHAIALDSAPLASRRP